MLLLQMQLFPLLFFAWSIHFATSCPKPVTAFGFGSLRGMQKQKWQPSVKYDKCQINYALPSTVIGATQRGQQDTTSATTENRPSSQQSSLSSSSLTWAKYAMLISSYTDGVLPSSEAQSFLKYSLACCLLNERVRKAESSVRESVMASPCNGPDMDAFNSLEQLPDLQNTEQSSEYEKSAIAMLQSLSKEEETVVRLLYIPTAMYALNPNSQNTPGKQRQRARADGKKRRSLVLQHLCELLQPHLADVNVLAITLDLDDGSLKQPVGSDSDSDFPKNGQDALIDWKPHIVYLEGGNTFWLQHCLEKGNWTPAIRAACAGPDATSLYIGKSAGAIIAGATVETATWKGWDDPSVVPGRENYDDWKGHPGMAIVGAQSFFPHMTGEWVTTVEEKRKDMGTSCISGQPSIHLSDHVICLEEWDACCVQGDSHSITILKAETQQ